MFVGWDTPPGTLEGDCPCALLQCGAVIMACMAGRLLLGCMHGAGSPGMLSVRCVHGMGRLLLGCMELSLCAVTVWCRVGLTTPGMGLLPVCCYSVVQGGTTPLLGWGFRSCRCPAWNHQQQCDSAPGDDGWAPPDATVDCLSCVHACWHGAILIT